jgi:hypothetical protein
MSSSTLSSLQVQGYIYKTDWFDVGYIGNDRMHRFSERITTLEGGKISIDKKDFYVHLATVESSSSSSKIQVITQKVPSTLFYGVKEGETIHYILDGRVIELTLAQQNFTKEDFTTVFLTLQTTLKTAERFKPMLHEYCIDVPRDEKYLLAFEEKQWRIIKGIVDFIELNREKTRSYDLRDGDSKLEDSFESMKAKFSFLDGFTYQVTNKGEPFRGKDQQCVDFGRFEFHSLTKDEAEFTLCLTTLFGEKGTKELGVIYCENKFLILAKGEIANPSIFPYNKRGDQYYRYFQSFPKSIKEGSLSINLNKGLLTLQGKFSE